MCFSLKLSYPTSQSRVNIKLKYHSRPSKILLFTTNEFFLTSFSKSWPFELSYSSSFTQFLSFGIPSKMVILLCMRENSYSFCISMAIMIFLRRLMTAVLLKSFMKISFSSLTLLSYSIPQVVGARVEVSVRDASLSDESSSLSSQGFAKAQFRSQSIRIGEMIDACMFWQFAVSIVFDLVDPL
jgi:hypothetical protein